MEEDVLPGGRPDWQLPEIALSEEAQPIQIPESSLEPPVLVYLGDGNWRLVEEYAYEHTGDTIIVPAGFTFDLSSVPRAFWWLIAPFELSVVAPLIHDFLYVYKGRPPDGATSPHRCYTRKQSDKVFKRIMDQEGVVWWRRRAGYRAVRLFGRVPWKKGTPASEC